jgi:hypothetical protein
LRRSSQTALLRAKKKATSNNTGKQTLTLEFLSRRKAMLRVAFAGGGTWEAFEMNIHLGCITNGWIYDAQSVS